MDRKRWTGEDREGKMTTDKRRQRGEDDDRQEKTNRR